jgi:histidine triad (HIT) family protein
MLKDEQANQIKEQLLKQVEHFPKDKQEMVKEKILSMNNSELEEFLKQNQIESEKMREMQVSVQGKNSSAGNCVFCSILSGQIPSYKIDENKDCVAILEINPVSKGHCLILPKKHIEEIEKIPTSCFTLAKKISKKIHSKLKPSEVKINPKTLFNHSLIEIIPIYEDTDLSKRVKADEKELFELQKILISKPRKKKQKKVSEKKSSNKSGLPRLERRIP